MTPLETALLLVVTVTVVLLAWGELTLLRHLGHKEGFRVEAWREVALGVLLFLAVAWLLWRVRATLPPFLIAAVLAIVLNPLILVFERRGWPRGRAVAAVFVSFSLVVAFVVTWFVPIVVSQTTELVASFPSYYQDARLKVEAMTSDERFQRLPDSVRRPIREQVEKAAGLIPQGLSLGMNFALSQLSRILWLILIPLTTLYLLLDLPKIQTSILKLVPYHHRAMVKEVAGEIGVVFGHYLRGLMLVSAAFGAATAVALTLLKVNYAWALGALAGVLYPVPYIGALCSTLLVTSIAYFQQEPNSLALALTAGATLVGTQAIFDNIIWPRVVGGTVGLHPLVSVFAMVAAGSLWGVMGVVVAVPVAKSLLVVLSRIYPRLIPVDPELNAEAEAAAVKP